MSKRNSKFRQLCWKCVNACNENLCKWVANNKYYKGTKIDSEGFITFCPNFIDDNKIISPKERAKKLGITYGYFNSLSQRLKKNNLPYSSVEEYHEDIKRRQAEIQSSKIYQQNVSKYHRIKTYLTRSNIKMSVDEYCEMRESKKNNKSDKSKSDNLKSQQRYYYYKKYKSLNLNITFEEYLKQIKDKRKIVRFKDKKQRIREYMKEYQRKKRLEKKQASINNDK